MVRQATLDEIDEETTEYFWRYIEELERTGRINIAKPNKLVDIEHYEYLFGVNNEEISCTEYPDVPSCGYVELDDREVKLIYAAKIAHGIWLDIHGHVPWKLKDYSTVELAYLFEKGNLLGSNGFISMIIDYSPSDLYSYLVDFVRTTPLQTLYAILLDVRADFRHGEGGERNLVCSPLTALTHYYNSVIYDDARRSSRQGCQSMSTLLVSMMINLNIPAFFGRRFFGGDSNHASAFFPTVRKILIHGDDPYQPELTATPNENLLMDYDYAEEHIGPASDLPEVGTTENRDFCVDRYWFLNGLNFPSDWTTELCCSSENPGSIYYGIYGSCAGYLDGNYGWMVTNGMLTEDEFQNFIATLESMCTD